MKWISIQDQQPPRNTFILVTDGKNVKPHYVNDIELFFQEEPTQSLSFEDKSKIKLKDITHWMLLPDPVNNCTVCELKQKEWDEFIREHNLAKELR